MTDSQALDIAPPDIAGVRRSFVEARGVRFHVTEAGPVDGRPVIADLTARLARAVPQYAGRPFHRVLVCQITAVTGWAALADTDQSVS